MCKDEVWIYLCSYLYPYQLQPSNTQTKTDPCVFPFPQPYYSAHTIAGSAFAVKAESEHSCLLLHLQLGVEPVAGCKRLGNTGQMTE